MCLILLAHQVNSQYQTVVAANRDEYFSRHSSPMTWQGNVLCGRDKVAGGTWFSVDTQGRWAVVSNYRESAETKGSISRGKLVSEYLSSQQSAADYLHDIASTADAYSGFNLLLSDHDGVFYFSNRNPGAPNLTPLPPGIYGLSNHLLDSAWPKVQLGKTKLQSLIHLPDRLQHEQLFELLADQTKPPEHQLPDTGIGIDREKALSSIFIAGSEYGTRCSTSLFLEKGGSLYVAEKSFPAKQIERFEFKIEL